MRIEVVAGNLARRFAGRTVVLDLRRRHEQPDRIRKAPRVAGVALRQRLPLGLVAVEQRRAAPAFQHRGELPAEIDRILDRGVVAKPAGRREQMRGVAAEEHAAAPELSATSV